MIEIDRAHTLAKDDAKRQIERIVKELENRLGLFGLVGTWKGDTLQLSASSGTADGTTGEVLVGRNTVRFRLTLPPALWAMRKSIETGLAQFLKRSFPT